MKTISLFLSILLFAVVFVSCDKDVKTTELESTTETAPVLGEIDYIFDYKALLMEYTSTGCPGCGSWGKPTFYNLADNHGHHIIPMAAHIKYGDPMISGVAEFFASNRTGSKFTPQIWVNDQSIMVLSGNSINGTASIDRANDLIMNGKKTTNVGLGSTLVIKNNKAYTKFGVKLNSDFAAGDYWVNSYLMEDGIIYKQLGYASNPATHNYVIRQAANGPWGNRVTKVAGKELEAAWEHTYLENIKEGQYLVTVLWKKEGGVYKPVNAVKVK